MTWYRSVVVNSNVIYYIVIYNSICIIIMCILHYLLCCASGLSSKESYKFKSSVKSEFHDYLEDLGTAISYSNSL